MVITSRRLEGALENSARKGFDLSGLRDHDFDGLSFLEYMDPYVLIASGLTMN
jgi:hypothetical protein